MTLELQSPLTEDRQPSEHLTLAIKECASGFRHLRDNINNAIEIGLEEGFSSKQVSSMVREELAKNGCNGIRVMKLSGF